MQLTVYNLIKLVPRKHDTLVIAMCMCVAYNIMSGQKIIDTIQILCSFLCSQLYIAYTSKAKKLQFITRNARIVNFGNMERT